MCKDDNEHANYLINTTGDTYIKPQLHAFLCPVSVKADYKLINIKEKNRFIMYDATSVTYNLTLWHYGGV